MKKWFKVLAILVCMLLIVSTVAACGRTDKSEQEDDSVQDSESQDSSDEVTPDADDDENDGGQTDADGNQEDGVDEDKADNEAAAVESTPPASPEQTPSATPEASEKPDSNTPSETPAPSDGKVEADEVLGVFEGNTYQNDFFGFGMEFPTGWTIASRDQLIEIYKLGTEFIKEGSSKDKVIDTALAQVVPLFLASRHPLGYVEGTNSNINGVAENISLAKSLISAPGDYVAFAAAFMQSQGIEVNIADTKDLTIGGRDFSRVDIAQTANGISTEQVMYVTLVGDHAVIFTLTYYSESEKEQLEDIVKSISFK